MKFRAHHLCLLLIGSGFIGCQQRGSDEDAVSHLKERWSNIDDPSLLGISLVFQSDQLPTYGSVRKIPWPGSYWPYRDDSINARWAGPSSFSPAEKYEMAFQKPGVVAQISRQYGQNTSFGPNPPAWFGLCHAWAPAAILEKEPTDPVTFNGVEFRPNDIKALVTLSYTEGLQVRGLSGRCNEKDLVLDSFGRPARPECRDTNAGTFHLLVTNLIGRMQRSFIEDKSIAEQVWNQPIRSYEILSQNRITDQNEIYRLRSRYNNAAWSFETVQMRLDYLVESPQHLDGNLPEDLYTHSSYYSYILELDRNGHIIGGEWTSDSIKDHPDFLWLPTKKHGQSQAAGVSWADVQWLLAQSVGEQSPSPSPEPVPTPQPSPHPYAYQFRFSHSGKCLASLQGSAVQQGCSGQRDQTWQLVPVNGLNSGSYLVKNLGLGTCLDIEQSSLQHGARVLSYPCYQTSNQIWLLERQAGANGQIFHRLRSKLSHQCLSVPAGQLAYSDHVQLYQQDCNRPDLGFSWFRLENL